jgi:transposase
MLHRLSAHDSSRHNILHGRLFTWRRQAKREAGDPPLAFTPVVVAPEPPQPTPAACREAVIEVVVAGAVIRVPSGADGATLALVLHALKSAR